MTGGDEPIAEISQAGGPSGYNGVTPEILIGGHLTPPETTPPGVTPGGGDPVKLCDSVTYNGNTGKDECKLQGAYVKWLYAYGNAAHPTTQDRYQLLTTLIDCALPTDYDVVIPGFPNEDGMFALYKDWITQSIPSNYRQVLSSCAASKVNKYGATVGIGIVGPGPTPFLPDPVDDPSFIYQEATFWGNLFDVDDRVYACSGKKAGGGSYIVGKNLRVCGQIGFDCNIIALGPCEGPYVSFCDGWAGSNTNQGQGGGEYCVSTNDGTGNHWKYGLTVYLKTEPQLVDGDVYRCGLKGDELCDDGWGPNGP
jgi:hypothetical protein